MKISETFTHEAISGFKFGSQPIGRPSFVAHVYVIDGLLIDTGQRNMRKASLSLLSPLPIQQIFITHHHEDHTGNLAELSQHFGCPAYASQACCDLMQAPPRISLAQNMAWGDRPAFHDLTPIAGTLNTPSYEFQLIPIPGHAPDMLALYEPNKKWLFSSDLYVNSYIGYFLFSESMAEQIASLKTILELDFDVMLCSHNPQFRNGKEKLQKKLTFLEGFYADVAELHAEGLGAKAIFRRLKLQENTFVKVLSGGMLSKLNMVKAVIRDETKTQTSY